MQMLEFITNYCISQSSQILMFNSYLISASEKFISLKTYYNKLRIKKKPIHCNKLTVTIFIIIVFCIEITTKTKFTKLNINQAALHYTFV